MTLSIGNVDMKKKSLLPRNTKSIYKEIWEQTVATQRGKCQTRNITKDYESTKEAIPNSNLGIQGKLHRPGNNCTSTDWLTTQRKGVKGHFRQRERIRKGTQVSESYRPLLWPLPSFAGKQI